MVVDTCQENHQVVHSLGVSNFRDYIGGRDLLPRGGDQSASNDESKHCHDCLNNNNIQTSSKSFI